MALKHRIYRLSSVPNLSGANRSFEKEFTSDEEAKAYCKRQHQLLIEYEGLELGSWTHCMATYFRRDEDGCELAVILVHEIE